MNNQELFRLFKNSKLAQVATPLGDNLRGRGNIPSHQIIHTPKSSMARSNFGLKTTLPKKIGFSHIVFNDIDNPKNMPDVERYSGSLYNRLKFQELGATVKNYFNENNPLFPSKTTSMPTNLGSNLDSVLAGLNLNGNVSTVEVERILDDNPNLHKKFQKWLVQKHPEAVLSSMPSQLVKMLKEFLSTAPDVTRRELGLKDFKLDKNAKATKIMGTGGFSYNQKGRLNNTPNGVRYGIAAMGRIVGEREAAIGGFTATVNDRTTLLQSNYSKNYPGKHPRQFVMPFKINEAEITESGKIKLFAEGIKVGSWMQKTIKNHGIDRAEYQASNPNFKRPFERNNKDNLPLESLLNLIGNKN